jgi:isoquinoline 1-oxidoreductase subunit beta
VACGIYKAASYAAVVADVEVNITTGQVRVTRLWCVHDCGQVINPDQVRAQCEGSLVRGIGMALMDRLPSSRRQPPSLTPSATPQGTAPRACH